MNIKANDVISTMMKFERNKWKDRLTGEHHTSDIKCFKVGNVTLSNANFHDMRQNYVKYTKGEIKKFDTFKDNRFTEMNSALKYINSPEFISSINRYIVDKKMSIDDYFQNLFSAILNADINALNKCFSDIGLKNKNELICSIAFIFGLRGNTSWYRKQWAKCSDDSKKKICFSNEAGIFLSHLALVKHSLSTMATIDKKGFNKNENDNSIDCDSTSLLLFSNKALLKLLQIKKNILNTEEIPSDRNLDREINNCIISVKKLYCSNITLGLLHTILGEINSSDNTRNISTEYGYYLNKLKKKNKISNFEMEDVYFCGYFDTLKSSYIKTILDEIEKEKKCNNGHIKQNLIYLLNKKISKLLIKESTFKDALIGLHKDLYTIVKNQINSNYHIVTRLPYDVEKDCLTSLFPFFKSDFKSDIVNKACDVSFTGVLKLLPPEWGGPFLAQIAETMNITTVNDIRGILVSPPSIRRRDIQDFTTYKKNTIDQRNGETDYKATPDNANQTERQRPVTGRLFESPQKNSEEHGGQIGTTLAEDKEIKHLTPTRPNRDPTDQFEGETEYKVTSDNTNQIERQEPVTSGLGLESPQKNSEELHEGLRHQELTTKIQTQKRFFSLPKMFGILPRILF